MSSWHAQQWVERKRAYPYEHRINRYGLKVQAGEMPPAYKVREEIELDMVHHYGYRSPVTKLHHSVVFRFRRLQDLETFKEHYKL